MGRVYQNGERKWQKGGEVIQYSDVTYSVFYTDHLFHFFKFINFKSPYLLYDIFHVLTSMKNLQMTSLPIVAYYFCISQNREPRCNRNSPMSEFLQEGCSFYFRMGNSSQQFCRTYFNAYSQNTCQYFCYFVLVFLVPFSTSQYFCGTLRSILTDHASVVFESTFQHFYRKFCSCFSEHLPVHF